VGFAGLFSGRSRRSIQLVETEEKNHLFHEKWCAKSLEGQKCLRDCFRGKDCPFDAGKEKVRASDQWNGGVSTIREGGRLGTVHRNL